MSKSWISKFELRLLEEINVLQLPEQWMSEFKLWRLDSWRLDSRMFKTAHDLWTLKISWTAELEAWMSKLKAWIVEAFMFDSEVLESWMFELETWMSEFEYQIFKRADKLWTLKSFWDNKTEHYKYITRDKLLEQLHDNYAKLEKKPSIKIADTLILKIKVSERQLAGIVKDIKT